MNQKIYPGQGSFYEGKVRNLHTVGGVIVAETTDRISAFDVVLPFEVPRKGVILNLIAAHFMRATEDIVKNCLLDVPHPRVSIWKKVKPFKVEFVVRGFNTGSFYRNYVEAGKANPWGYSIPSDCKKNVRLPEVFINPTTKAPKGEHDEDISFEDILERGLMTKNQLEHINRVSRKLFLRGQEMAADRGLILVDTKYEFGEDESGEVYLIDEIHTPDSSRYWYANTYETALAENEEPKALSKEFVRQWLVEHNWQGKDGDVLPVFDDALKATIKDRYQELYQIVVGTPYTELSVNDDDLYEKVCASLVKIRPAAEGPKVSIVMGSESDLPVMKKAADVLVEAGVPFELSCVSAHRTPVMLQVYAQELVARGVKVVIAGAGGAAHLPGMIAAHTIVPVIGVPVKSSNSIDGWDSILSILQMPGGVPVATMALDGAQNAGLLALQILATADPSLAKYLGEFKNELQTKVRKMRNNMVQNYYFPKM